MKAKMVIFSIAFFALTGHNFFHNNVTFDVFFIDPAKKKVNSLVPNKFDVNWTSNTPSPNTQYGRRRI